MAKSKRIVRCTKSKGARAGQRWHKPSKSCRTPCAPGYRRSPKGPYYKCIPRKYGPLKKK